jgi:hypothetical protein
MPTDARLLERPCFWTRVALLFGLIHLGMTAAGVPHASGEIPAILSAKGPLPQQSYSPLSHRMDEWYGSTYWTGPGWTRIGRDWQHPGDGIPCIRTFRCKRDGTVQVTGRVYKAHLSGDGVRASILHNEEIVWEGEIEGTDAKGLTPDLTLKVEREDALRFMVHQRGSISCDTTRWNPVVTYKGGKTFQASSGFSTSKQGENGWFYEMPQKTSAQVAEKEDIEWLRALFADSAPGSLPEPELMLMVVAAWRQEDRLSNAESRYKKATAEHIEKCTKLIADLRENGTPGFLSAEVSELKRLALASKAGTGTAESRSLYYQVRWLKRRVILANPLMDFGPMLFCKRVPTEYSHQVMQYFGWRARPGGGLFVLEKPGTSLACRDILDGRLKHGNVLEPRLSYDGKRIVFSFVNCGQPNPAAKATPDPSDKDFYHLYEVRTDGTGLQQLTHGAFDDLMPAYLPDGGIVFSSTRRRGYARCFGAQFGTRWHTYTLHRCEADGSKLRTLSYHDTNEWFPAVANDGRIIYARWDYIDRDAVTHQNLWATRPDGSNPLAVWGNAAPKPHCTFQCKPIPDSNKFVFIASAHHSITAGTVCLLDPSVHDNDLAAITRVTPEIPFPEAESRDIREYYTAPRPLSDKYFLVAYSPLPLAWEPQPNHAHALGLYLLDVFGNRELIYRDPDIGSTTPTPLRPSRIPPVVSPLPQTDSPEFGTVTIADVYKGLGDIPRGTAKKIRVVQIFPKITPIANRPHMGVAGEENGRAILGTAPVEDDGSAYFTVPSRTPILFQVLDEEGCAIQTMRSLTYLQPGETVSCVGCHESQRAAPYLNATRSVRKALLRPPSKLDPGQLGGRPFGFAEMVQPVLDRHCTRCHGEKKQDGKVSLSGTPQGAWTQSYAVLTRDSALVPRYRARNQVQITPPGGKIGARGSRLMKLLRGKHEGVKVPLEDRKRIAAWIDCNAIFYGSPDEKVHPTQLSGKPVPMPAIQ